MGPDRYIRKLVSAGHKVGVVSQTETAAEKRSTREAGEEEAAEPVSRDI